jgi:hypothetical protein
MAGRMAEADYDARRFSQRRAAPAALEMAPARRPSGSGSAWGGRFPERLSTGLTDPGSTRPARGASWAVLECSHEERPQTLMHQAHRAAREPAFPRHLMHQAHRAAREPAFPRHLMHRMHQPPRRQSSAGMPRATSVPTAPRLNRTHPLPAVAIRLTIVHTANCGGRTSATNPASSVETAMVIVTRP